METGNLTEMTLLSWEMHAIQEESRLVEQMGKALDLELVEVG